MFRFVESLSGTPIYLNGNSIVAIEADKDYPATRSIIYIGHGDRGYTVDGSVDVVWRRINEQIEANREKESAA